MASTYYQNLIRRVLDSSVSNIWDEAVSEWYIADCEEDETLDASCICGKENLRYLFTIRNDINGNELFPIGSSCIKKFGRNDLNNEADIHEDMFKLMHAVAKNEFITLDSVYFSRKLLYALYEEGAFAANKYNSYDGENDYQFMLNMFNKRHKDDITLAQRRKIGAIIINSIGPFLVEKLQYKTNSRDI